MNELALTFTIIGIIGWIANKHFEHKMPKADYWRWFWAGFLLSSVGFLIQAF